MRFGGKTDQERMRGLRRKTGQDVGVLAELQRQVGARLLLQFARRDFARTVIAHRRRRDVDIGLCRAGQHRRVHLCRTAHVDALRHARRRAQAHGAGHQRDVCALLRRCLRHREAHAAGTAVADETYRVDVLESGARAHQDVQPRQGAATEGSGQRIAQLQRFQHPARAHVATGLFAGRRAQHLRAALAQGGEVGLHRRVCPHLLVHRRRQVQRRGAGEA